MLLLTTSFHRQGRETTLPRPCAKQPQATHFCFDHDSYCEDIMRAFGSNHGQNGLHSSPVEPPQAEQQGNPQRPPQRDRSSTPAVTGNIVMNDGYAYPVFQSSSPPGVTPPPMASPPGWYRQPAATMAHENMTRPTNYPQGMYIRNKAHRHRLRTWWKHTAEANRTSAPDQLLFEPRSDAATSISACSHRCTVLPSSAVVNV